MALLLEKLIKCQYKEFDLSQNALKLLHMLITILYFLYFLILHHKQCTLINFSMARAESLNDTPRSHQSLVTAQTLAITFRKFELMKIHDFRI